MALDLLEPTVVDRPQVIAGAPRLSDLHGKRVGFVDNSKCNADLFIQRLVSRFSDRFAVLAGPIVRKAPAEVFSGAPISSSR